MSPNFANPSPSSSPSLSHSQSPSPSPSTKPTPLNILLDPEDAVLYQDWLDDEEFNHRKFVAAHRRREIPAACEYMEFTEWKTHQASGFTDTRREPSGSSTFLDSTSSSDMEDVQASMDPDGGQQSPEESKEEERIISRGRKCGHSFFRLPERGLDDPMADPPSPANNDFENVGTTHIHDPDVINYCPLCITHAHLSLVTALLQTWVNCGGPWRKSNRETDPQTKWYYAASKQFRQARTKLANIIERYDREAAEMDGDDGGYGAKAAMKAFIERWQAPCMLAVTYGEEGDVVSGWSEILPLPPSTQKKKTVTFSVPTTERDREQNKFSTFWRHSRHYDPEISIYACPEDSESWQDTSFKHDHYFTIAQSRILLLKLDDDTGDYEYQDINKAESFGNNLAVWRLQMLVSDTLATMTLEERSDMATTIASSSLYWLVWKENEGETMGFDDYMALETLAGSLVQKHAIAVGDLDPEDAKPVVEVSDITLGLSDTASSYSGSPYSDMSDTEEDSREEDSTKDETTEDAESATYDQESGGIMIDDDETA
ncbi:hypothetical protein BU24DRAFT_476602 [Aaosphaeria arxii CBS 175.79]|uniref:Uncharacterized protein n=1 Tax=Aaosphaeria arxii CBS 175.79 TaxID=1450172 RepID=A0A6A5Y4T2_9PLEO|nr:uncharacterized protein BU24DRAFT_476602 [Aaosphaeria arxii CBS 175.79]KAF2019524.1 hypothetical protein BU24DRAFT_476602 [Aaosphaeria arxii CBS 175.79]